MLDGVVTVGKKTHQVNQMGIARTFQNIRLFNNMSVLDNVKVGMHSSIRQNLFWRSRTWQATTTARGFQPPEP